MSAPPAIQSRIDHCELVLAISYLKHARRQLCDLTRCVAECKAIGPLDFEASCTLINESLSKLEKIASE